MSRGRWLVFGSTLTLMSCDDTTSKPQPTLEAGAFDAARLDVATDGLDTSTDAAADDNGVDDASRDDAGHDANGDSAGNDASGDDASGDDASGDDAGDDSFDAGAGTDAEDGGNDGSSTDASGDAADANPDVSLDGGRQDGPDGAYFACCLGPPSCGTWCNRKTEICNVTTIPFSGGPHCRTHDGGALGNFPEQCMPEPSCACIRPFYAGCGLVTSTWACGDEGGAVILSCNGCYGSPPVQWERFIDSPLADIA